MSKLDPRKLHLSFLGDTSTRQLLIPRKYTLTHSDFSGDFYLSIGSQYNQRQISGWYTRLMRDELLAEWQAEEGIMALHVYGHVSGGLALGPAGWRYGMLLEYMELAIAAFYQGDQEMLKAHPELCQARVWVHFEFKNKNSSLVKDYGTLDSYQGFIID